MKLRASLLLVLAVLSLSGIGLAHSSLSRAAENVVFTEQTLMGDPSAAQGLALRVSFTDRYRLFWNSVIRPGQEAETAVSRSPLDGQFSAPGETVHLSANDDLYNSAISHPDGVEPEWLSEPISQTMDRTSTGTTHEEFFPLRELPLSAYPLNLELCSTKEGPLSASSESAIHYVPAEFTKHFRFPLPEDCTMHISVTRNEDGLFSDISARLEGGYQLSHTRSALVGSYLYFLLDVRTQDGQLADYRNTPGGYGVYRLRYDALPSFDSLELVYPLSEADHTRMLASSTDGSQALLIVEDEEAAKLLVLDAARPENVQSVPLTAPNKFSWQMDVQPEHLWVEQLEGNFFLLSPGENGKEQIRIRAARPTWSRFCHNYYPLSTAFDGERLAIVWDHSTIERDQSQSSPYLLLQVYDQSGLLYSGYYTSSLNQGSAGCQLCARLSPSWE